MIIHNGKLFFDGMNVPVRETLCAANRHLRNFDKQCV